MLGADALAGRSELRLVLPAGAGSTSRRPPTAVAPRPRRTRRGAWDGARAALAILDQGFLPGEDGPWADGAPQRARRLRLRALECLAAGGTRLGARRRGRARRARAGRRGAVPRARPRLLMEALAAGGNVAEALRAYEDAARPAARRARRRARRRGARAARARCWAGRARPPEPPRGAQARLDPRRRAGRRPGRRPRAARARRWPARRERAARRSSATAAPCTARSARCRGRVRRARRARGRRRAGPCRAAREIVAAVPASRPARRSCARGGLVEGEAVTRALALQQTAGAGEVGDRRAARRAARAVGTRARTRRSSGASASWRGCASAARAARGRGRGGHRQDAADDDVHRRASRPRSSPAAASPYGERHHLVGAARGGLGAGRDRARRPGRRRRGQAAPAGRAALGDDAARVADAIALTAGIALAESRLDGAPPATVAAEIEWAWPRLLSALAAAGPLVLRSTTSTSPSRRCSTCSRRSSRAPTGRCSCSSPRGPSSPGGDRRGPRWSLGPLPRRASACELAGDLLGDAGDALRERVAAHAEGNPFFLEQLARHVVDERAPAAALPPSVRALLAARLDALGAEAKRALQDAAVVGRTFWASTLEAMRPGAPVRTALSAAQERGFVATRPASSLPGQPSWRSGHGLIREVAYRSLPLAERAARARRGRALARRPRRRAPRRVRRAARPPLRGGARRPATERPARAAAVAALLDAGRAAHAPARDRRRARLRGAGAAARARRTGAARGARAARERAARGGPRQRGPRRLPGGDRRRRRSRRRGARACAPSPCSCARATAARSRPRRPPGGDWRCSTPASPRLDEARADVRDRRAARRPRLRHAAAGVALRADPAARGATRSARSRSPRRSAPATCSRTRSRRSSWMTLHEGFGRAASSASACSRPPTGSPTATRRTRTWSSGRSASPGAARARRAIDAAAGRRRRPHELSPHRALHAAAAQTIACCRRGASTSCARTTADVLDLLRADRGGLCATAAVGLAGQAVALFEAGDDRGARRVVDVLDAAWPSLQRRRLSQLRARGPGAVRPARGRPRTARRAGRPPDAGRGRHRACRAGARDARRSRTRAARSPRRARSGSARRHRRCSSSPTWPPRGTLQRRARPRTRWRRPASPTRRRARSPPCSHGSARPRRSSPTASTRWARTRAPRYG